MTHTYRYLSADSHMEIDSKWWIERVPARYRNQAPRVLRLPDGSDAWLIEGVPLRQVPFDLYGGKGRDVWKPWGQNYDTTPGTGPAEQRVREQQQDGIDGEILFPGQASGPNFWRNIRDDEAYKACVRAYNDFVAEDYRPVAPERLLTLGVIPLTGLQDALAELEHIRSIGLPGIVLYGFPSGKGLPTPEDDTFWQRALELQMPISVHQEFNREGPRSGAYLRYPRPLDNKTGRLGPLTDLAAQVGRFGRLGFLNGVQMALDGVFERFPQLELFFAETQIGWLPWAYEMADIRYERHRYWAEEVLGWQPLPLKPTDYLKKHLLWGFQQDSVGVTRLRDLIGVDKILWATDFPHQESEFPHSDGVIQKNFAGVPTEDVQQIVAGNAIRFFHLDATVAPLDEVRRVPATVGT
ncbi:MAG TPA: amidohydrolase family protein [Chloroflexota bacterium]|jgi:predicted TIM-barrel fold metal-dependent hydrolase